MRTFLDAAKPVLLDGASTLGFLAVFLLTGRLAAAVACGMALGIAQLGAALLRKRPAGALQFLSLFIVLASGISTLITNDPRFVMLKPSLFYAIAGGFMLKRGWMIRYLPPIAKQLVPDIAIIFGYAWAILMLASAVLNIFVALHCSVHDWAIFMAVFGGFSKTALFVCSYVLMRFIATKRRARAVAISA